MPHGNINDSFVSSTSTLQGSYNAGEPNKLILCFDGTGNTFTGSNADTNVVKILGKLDRNDPNQYHYYQTGIGTYNGNDQSVEQTWFGEMWSSVTQTIDQGIGTTFDEHVMAGYRFLMRFYSTGDKIYMFGFSRGAFTAKFLARMINTVGLLCKGNEEMVPFAYRLYQRYLAGEIADFRASNLDHGNTGATENGTAKRKHRGERAHNEITAFSKTFCRRDKINVGGKIVESNIKVYFLGIWDCVNSVAVLERKAPVPVPVTGTAHYVRHAVAVDEHRVKFKPALLAQDIRSADHDVEDIKEVWFPGCHGDVGGGWPAVEDNPLDNTELANTQPMTFWQRVKNFWTTRKAKEPSRDVRSDPFQISDVPLAWMIREVELVGKKDPKAAVKWLESVYGFKKRFQLRKEQALKGLMHDSLQFGHGTGFFTVLLWKFLEWNPLFTRWELKGDRWSDVRFPLNKGAARDIPPDAVLHESLLWRLRNNSDYCPRNNHGGWLPPCLKHKGCVAKVDPVLEANASEDLDKDHQTYTFVDVDE